MTTFC